MYFYTLIISIRNIIHFRKLCKLYVNFFLYESAFVYKTPSGYVICEGEAHQWSLTISWRVLWRCETRLFWQVLHSLWVIVVQQLTFQSSNCPSLNSWVIMLILYIGMMWPYKLGIVTNVLLRRHKGWFILWHVKMGFPGWL